MLSASGEESLLHYGEAAASFLQALPLGNGRLGAMLYGQLRSETIELNEDTLWSGGPGDRNDYRAADHLDALRQAVLVDRDYVRADQLAGSMQGPPTDAYQPLGTLHVDYRESGEATGYRRSLDLRTATGTVRCTSGGVDYTRTSFVSAPSQVLVHRISCSAAGRLGFTARISSPHPTTRERELTMGRAPAGIAADGVEYAPEEGTGFGIGLRVLTEGGTVTAHPDGGITVADADAATILVATGTGFRDWRTTPTGADAMMRGQLSATLTAAADRPFAELHTEHVQDHRRLFDRAGLRLGDPPPNGARPSGARPTDERPSSARPTDERLAAVRAGGHDPGLVALYFNYGRYLLIASSRPGTQPANLQGIWNREVRPPWNCDWTTNINTQMNYWPAESTGLAECHEPLFDLIADLAEAGQRTATAYYRCRGWAAHHNVDLWRSTNPVDGGPQWANWPMAGPWLCAHLWQHYLYSGDHSFLAERAYPAMRGAALFLLDFLTEDGDGALVSCPSTSPEHRFHAADGSLVAVSAGTAMDYWLIDELFASCSRAAALLGTDADLSARLDAARARLRRPLTGPDGTLLEWWDDFADEDPGHRHLSHLYGLYPGSQVTAEGTPELLDAARRALHLRLEHGGGGTGWSLAWVTALAARLGDGELAHRSVTALLAGSTADNLLDLHPPRIFQIDGNLGATAAIAELLLRNQPDGIRLLPALPRAWGTGSVHGLRGHGGIVVDLEWIDHHLERATLHTARAGVVTVTTPARGSAPLVVGPDDRPVAATHAIDHGEVCRSSFPAQANSRYQLVPG
ncbi:alpha-L-fucosidase 2 [Streptacidiphilus sp. MAP12-16]|uniref:glycoside hydrolase family 95 protein n=1 Tax=Streptacidiphilus sp. MAP12-16 TaxID=3156300 RepID=UPI003514C3E7